jgi:hypothetical protein
LYRSTTALAVPLAANLAAGELAINITDGKLYYNDGGVVKLLASNATSAPVLSFQTSLGGLTPSTATTGVVTLAGTLNTSSGGTGLSSYTAGDLSYYASGTAFTKLAIGTAGQILTSSGTAPQWSTLTGVAVTTFSAGTTGFTPSTATSGAITLAGTLATTNGGTGLTTFTANGVVYASSSSALATGSALTFDGTNFGVGAAWTTNPLLSTQPLYFQYNATNSVLAVAGDATSSIQSLRFSSNTSGALISFNKARGTYASPSAVASGDNIGVLSYRVYGGTSARTVASIIGTVDTYTSDTDISSLLTFNLSPSGSAAAVEQMRLTSTGLGVNTTTPTSGLQTAGSSSKSAFKTPNIAEVDTISATAATGTINFDITTQSVLFYTSNASGNWTVNFRGSSGTSLNTVMQTGESISATFLVTQGATAYYNSVVQIDGTTVTPKWQGGTAPTSGNASSVDCYTYVIQKTGSATYVVLASQTKFA